jgi:hypothetical protein
VNNHYTFFNLNNTEIKKMGDYASKGVAGTGLGLGRL